MRFRRLFAAAIIALLMALRSSANPPFPARPKLVVLIAVDQFRYDYLTRFGGEYTGGIHRLLTEGAVFANANLAHYPSVTAVGHATMLTGATPALSGIVGNEWVDRITGRIVTSVSDPSERELGGVGGEGASPRRLLVSTVGDEMKIADGNCRVIGISIKDRAAILPAGHLADGAYWLDTQTGSFASSSYYFRDLPSWVKPFAQSKALEQYAGREWKFFGSSIRMPLQTGPKLANAVYFSPFGIELLERFAEHAIEGEKLGQRGRTDLLTVSFSSIDAVGHQTGPYSPQIHDLALSTDREIGRLFAYIDKTIGLKDVVVVLTADHGVADLPDRTANDKMPGGRIQDAELSATAQTALQTEYGPGKWVIAIMDGAIYLNQELIQTKKLNTAEVEETAADALMRVPHVFRVYTREQIRHGEVPQDSISRILSRSLNWQRSGNLQVILDPHWIRPAKNTSHDSPFAYDRHIPLIFMGPGVKPGLYYREADLNDLAPTLATMLSVQIPSGSVGRVLDEILNSRTKLLPKSIGR